MVPQTIGVTVMRSRNELGMTDRILSSRYPTNGILKRVQDDDGVMLNHCRHAELVSVTQIIGA